MSVSPAPHPDAQDLGRDDRRRGPLRSLHETVMETPWSPRTAVVVATAVCLAGLLITAQGPLPERNAIMFLVGAGWTVMGAYHRTAAGGPAGGIAVLVGATWFVARLDEAADPWLFTIGNILAMAPVPVLILAFMTFPTGRIGTSPAALDPATHRIDTARVRHGRRLVCATAAWAALLNLWVLFDPYPNPGCAGDCRGRNLMIAEVPAISVPLQVAQAAVGIVLGLLVMRWVGRASRNLDALHRSAYAPARAAIWLSIGMGLLFIAVGAMGAYDLARPAYLVAQIGLMVVPVLYGFGLYRWLELERTVMAEIGRSTASGHAAVERVLRDALGDPTLRVLPVAAGAGGLPTDDPCRSVLRTPEGRALAVVEHTPRMPGSELLPRALAWAERRLITTTPGEPDDLPGWDPRVRALTDAELATVALLADQRTNREIAEAFTLTLGSVNNRVSRIYRKLELHGMSRRERVAALARLASLVAAERERRDDGSS